MEISCPHCRRRFEARSRRIECPFCSASIDAWEVLIGQRAKAMGSAANHSSYYEDSDFLEIPTFLVPKRTLPDPYLVLEQTYDLTESEPIITAPAVLASPPKIDPPKGADVDVPPLDLEPEIEDVRTTPELQPATSVEVEAEPASASMPAEVPIEDTGPATQVSPPRRRGRLVAAIAAVAIGAIALYWLLGRGSLLSGSNRGRNAAAASLGNTPQPSASSSVLPDGGSSASAPGALAVASPSSTENPTATPHKSKTTPTPESGASGDAGTPPAVLSSPTAPTSDENASSRARTVTGSESSGGIFTLQIAARSNEDEAKAIADRLIDKGYDARIIKTSGAGKMWYRVRVGMFNSREEAARYGEQMKQAGTVAEYFVTDRQH